MTKKITNLYTDAFSGLSRDIWLLTFVTLVNRCGTMVVPFIAIFLTQEMNFTKTESGIILAFFGAGSAVGVHVGGILTDKFGHYRVMFWSLLASGLALLNLLFVNSFEMWCLAVFMVTAIGDCYRPASMAAVGFYSKPENQTRSLGLIRLAINLGFGIGPAFGGLLAATLGYDWIFIVDGLTCIFSAFFFLAVLKDKHRPQAASEEESEEKEEVKSPYKDKVFLWFILAMFINSIVFFQFMGTLTVYFKEVMSFSDGQVGALLGMNGIIIALIEMPLIFVLEKRGKILLWIAAGLFLTGVAHEVLTWTMWGGIAVISMLALTFGEIISFPFAASYSLSRAQESNRGRYMGLYGLSFSAGHIIAPILGMYLADTYGYQVLWHSMGALALVSVLVVYVVIKQENKKALPALVLEGA